METNRSRWHRIGSERPTYTTTVVAAVRKLGSEEDATCMGSFGAIVVAGTIMITRVLWIWLCMLAKGDNVVTEMDSTSCPQGSRPTSWIITRCRDLLIYGYAHITGDESMVLEAFHDMCRCASMLANQTS
jgi:hypothetical protein